MGWVTHIQRPLYSAFSSRWHYPPDQIYTKMYPNTKALNIKQLSFVSTNTNVHSSSKFPHKSKTKLVRRRTLKQYKTQSHTTYQKQEDSSQWFIGFHYLSSHPRAASLCEIVSVGIRESIHNSGSKQPRRYHFSNHHHHRIHNRRVWQTVGTHHPWDNRVVTFTPVIEMNPLR